MQDVIVSLAYQSINGRSYAIQGIKGQLSYLSAG